MAEALLQTLLERAIGVVYRPQSEFGSHYFKAVLADQFDAYVWFEQSRAVTPLLARTTAWRAASIRWARASGTALG